MTENVSERLMSIHDEVRDAHRKLLAAVTEHFQPGTPVEVKWGRNWTEADVVEVSPYSPRVYVESVHGKRYWVDATRLREFGYWGTP